MLTSKNKLTKTLTQHLNNNNKESEDDDDLSVEINDKLSELWTGMRNKRKLMMRNLTPGNSRRSEQTLSSIKNGNNNNRTTTNILQQQQLEKNSTIINEIHCNNKEQQEESFVLTHHHLAGKNRNNKKSENKNNNNNRNLSASQSNEQQETIEIRKLKQTIDKLSHDNSELMIQLKNCFRQTGGGSTINGEEEENEYYNENNTGEILNECTEIEIRENYSIDDNSREYIEYHELKKKNKNNTKKNNNLETNEHALEEAIADGRTANFYQHQQQQHEYNKEKNKNKDKSKHNKKSFISAKNDRKHSKSIKQQKNSNNSNNRESLLLNNNNKSRNNNSDMSTTTITNKENANPNKYNCSNNNEIRNHSHSHESHSHLHEHITATHPTTFPNEETLETLSHHRLIQLLKFTTEYREFAYYYDSHELSYLKRLQHMHKKNCYVNLSEKEMKYWVPTELLCKMKEANAKNEWGLKEEVIEEIIGEMKCYYERNQEMKLNEQRDYLMKKIHKLKREKENNIPYDLVRLTNAKERESSVTKKTSYCHSNNNTNKINTNKNNMKSTTIR